MTLRYGRSRDGSRYSQWRCPYYPLPAVCYQPRIVHGAFKADRGGRAKFSDQDSCWVSLSWRLVECTARAVIVVCLGGKRGVIGAKFVNRNCYACWWKERQNNRASNFPCPLVIIRVKHLAALTRIPYGWDGRADQGVHRKYEMDAQH